VEENFPFTLPITICCDSCSEDIHQGTELFVHKEEVIGEKYPNFEIYLICFNCTNCSAELWIRSDPENKDYVVESGATKKHAKEGDDQVAVSKKQNGEAEQGGDALKSLENTTLDSKTGIAALDEMKSMEIVVTRKRKAHPFLMTDALKSVDNTTLDSKREITAVKKMKSMESQHATVSVDAMLEVFQGETAKKKV